MHYLFILVKYASSQSSGNIKELNKCPAVEHKFHWVINKLNKSYSRDKINFPFGVSREVYK